MSRRTKRRGAQRELAVDLHAPIDGQLDLDLFVPSAEAPAPQPRTREEAAEPELEPERYV